MFRFICVVTTVVTFLILSIPLLIAEWIIGKFNPTLKDKSSKAVIQWAFGLCLKISGVEVTYIGKERIPTDTAVLYVPNHTSAFDILLTYVQMPSPTGYVAKDSLQKWPLLSNWMRNIHCLFLDRSNIKEGMKMILAAIEKMKSGISICIFPEGTRNKEKDSFLPFHAGSFKNAEKSHCPVVPVAIVNASAMFEDQFPKIKPVRVIIEYGEPIYPDQLDKAQKKNLCGMTEAEIKRMYFKNKELL